MRPQDNIDMFPGSVQDYERFKKYEVEIADTGGRHKFVYAEDDKLLFQMIDSEGVEALVNIGFNEYGHLYGLPVRKKK